MIEETPYASCSITIRALLERVRASGRVWLAAADVAYWRRNMCEEALLFMLLSMVAGFQFAAIDWDLSA